MAIHSFIKIFLINVFVGTFSLLQAQILISASVITPGDAGILSEKCSGPYKLVIRRDASNQDTTLIFISDLGVAQAGVDYNFPAGSFPVTLLPKDSMVMIPVLVVNDGLNEGLESLVWEIAYLAGTQSGAINVETAITDQYSVTINSPDTIVWCRDLNYILLATSDAEIHWLPSDNFIDSTGEAATVRPHESG
ncbi:MAG: hypothetical protein ABIQ02_07780, partial [Saprospiraceae bacterium]